MRDLLMETSRELVLRESVSKNVMGNEQKFQTPNVEVSGQSLLENAKGYKDVELNTKFAPDERWCNLAKRMPMETTFNGSCDFFWVDLLVIQKD
mmetsp:Transcript_30198/g.47329  ORF Transcript_30198/g.47329 Transcript_30198/m.47329 type:complete len:94 (+) Transcript_30198:2516-2797(+)